MTYEDLKVGKEVRCISGILKFKELGVIATVYPPDTPYPCRVKFGDGWNNEGHLMSTNEIEATGRMIKPDGLWHRFCEWLLN